MLTDDVINQIYKHEKHYKYSSVFRLILRIAAIALFIFTVFILIKEKNFALAVIQFVVTFGLINESKLKTGYELSVLEDIVGQLVEINIAISKITDNSFRLEATKEFNYYIDSIVGKPSSISSVELSKFIKKILAELDEQEYNTQEEEKFKSNYSEQHKESNESTNESTNETTEKTTYNFFNNCFTIKDLNKRKRELLKQYHPDSHTDELERQQCEEISKQINEEYSVMKKALLDDFSI